MKEFFLGFTTGWHVPWATFWSDSRNIRRGHNMGRWLRTIL